MEKIKLTKISVEQLRTLSERGGFYISVEETRLRKLIKDLKIKKYWGPPRLYMATRQGLVDDLRNTEVRTQYM